MDNNEFTNQQPQQRSGSSSSVYMSISGNEEGMDRKDSEKSGNNSKTVKKQVKENALNKINSVQISEGNVPWSSQSEQSRGPYREQDIYLPIANVARIMKGAVPTNGKIAKDAKECVQECVSEFISFITSEAAEHCSNEKRKTINGEDVLFAMSSLGFDPYIEPLKIYLQTYRDALKTEKSGMQPYGANNPPPSGGNPTTEDELVASGMGDSFQPQDHHLSAHHSTMYHNDVQYTNQMNDLDQM